MRPVWVVGAVLVLLPFAFRAYQERRRQRRDLLALARRRNLRFSPVDLIGLHDRYSNLDIIRRGHSRHACNVLYGSIEAGLVAVFRFSYDLGFGVHQSTMSWWVAVVESMNVFETWQAKPIKANAVSLSVATYDASAEPLRIGGVIIRADHADTLNTLRQPEIQSAIQAMPPDAHIEVRGPLLAAAVPFTPDSAVADRLLHSLGSLAEQLRTAGT